MCVFTASVDCPFVNTRGTVSVTDGHAVVGNLIVLIDASSNNIIRIAIFKTLSSS